MAKAQTLADWRVVGAAFAGNVLEFYDLNLYAYFAGQIGAAYFPASTQLGSELAAWGSFAVAFIARPIGAVVLGSYADRAGRKAALTLALALMLAGTTVMACMPSAAQIGVLAPIGVLLARLVQGFSVGGEFGGASAFMSEHASAASRGMFGSFQFMGQALSNILASLAGLTVVSLLPPDAVAAYGFRLPFLFGLLLGPVGLYLRTHVPETPEFLAAEKLAQPARVLMSAHKARITLAALIITVGTVATYLNIYIPSYAQSVLKLPPWIGYAVTLGSSLIALIATPLSAMWSDRSGRLRPAFIGAWVIFLASVPLMAWAVRAPGLVSLMGAMLVLACARAIYSAPLPALLAELFPVQLRAVGMSVGYTLGVTVFGGLTPLLCRLAISWSGDKAAPGYIVMAASVVSLVALWQVARREESSFF